MCLCVCMGAAGILDVMFRLLDSYRNKQYITPRVLQLVLSYLAQSYVDVRQFPVVYLSSLTHN